MMKHMVKYFVLGLGVWGMTSGLSAVTGAEVAKEPTKYGVVDMQAVILNVEEGKAARAELETEIKKKETELGKQKEELDKMNEEWKSQAAMLSEAARLKKQQDFQERFLGLRNAEMSFQNDIKRREQKATQKIAVNVAKMVEKISKDRGFDAVFELNSSGLLYLKNPVDLTKDVIAAYSKQNPGKAVAKKDDKAPAAAPEAKTEKK